MQSHFVKSGLKTAVCVTFILLLGALVASAQVTVNLTANGQSTTLPDGSSVPMWGWTCGNTTAISVVGGGTCGALNGMPQSGATIWQPPLITVPAGSSLTINLANNLQFNGNNIPTSLVIVGQLGGGLGKTATSVPSPSHATLGTTWPIAGDTSGSTFNPPQRSTRVQSFANEVTFGNTVQLQWTNLNPGTYLIESGTHPSIQGPMGLYGVLVVTTAPSGGTAGTAYPGVNYAGDVPLLLSEIDPTQNNSVNAAVLTAKFSEISVYVARDSVSSVTVNADSAGNPIGGTGYVVGDAVSITGGGFSVQATAHVSGVDSTTGTITAITVDNSGQGYTSVPSLVTVTSVAGTGAQLTANLSLAAGARCSDGAGACYPPAVNYTPLYYLINGQAFDKTNPANSLFAATPGSAATPISGTVLVRLVNAGLRMHVPSIVGSMTGTTASGFSLIAEDGNPLPGVPRVQSEVFMAAGKTYDVMINVPTAGGNALPIFDRQLSLSGNSTRRDSGMLAYIGVNGSTVPAAAAFVAAQANPDIYNSIVCPVGGTGCNVLTISDPSRGVVANDVNIFGVKFQTPPAQGTLALNLDGTFTYTPNSGWATSDTFTYCGNGATTANACATVTLNACTSASGCLEAATGISVPNSAYTANTATYLAIKTPGVLMGAVDAAGYPLTVDTSTVTLPSGSQLSVIADANGGFVATAPGSGTYSFTFQAKNSQGTHSSAATVMLTFPTANGPTVTVLDGADKKTQIADYRWIIEEDRTFYIDPNCTTNPLPSNCPTISSTVTSPLVFGTNFHTSYMPVVATGCTGPLSCESGQTQGGSPVVCDVGNGVCRPDTTGTGQTPVDPSQVHLDPVKRYYISILPGDAANPFNAAYAGTPACASVLQNGVNVSVPSGTCGHGMGGAPIGVGQTAVTVMTVPSPYPPAKLTVFVFEDDFPLNGEHDAGGGIDVLSPNEPGLGGFQITLFDDAGGTGDATGQPTYDMFNMPLTNSLAGTIDPMTGLDACPISTKVTANAQLSGDVATPDVCSADPSAKGCQKGIVGMIVSCPTYESDGTTLSPLAGQAVVNNLYQGRYGVMATPAADRIARGEEWLQTNTLDGQKAHDSFMRIGEPAYFQEFGPAGYHVTIGFANPKIINGRLPGVCSALTGTDSCTNEVKGHITTARMSRTPDERLYGSGSRDSFSFTQCYASLGDPDGADFAFVKCDDKGNFDFTGIPSGNWKLSVFDQWNDQIVDGISTPIGLASQSNAVVDLGEVAVHQWQANIYTRTFLDANGNGVSDKDSSGNDTEAGLTLVLTNVRFRDGSFSNFNNTDLNGYANFNEVFPLFSWYVVETDTTRYKSTGTHVVYDTGGPTDGTCGSTTAPCGSSTIGQNMANTYEANPLPSNLSVPGAVYCAEGADCGTSAASFVTGTPVQSSTSNHSSGRIDPPFWFGSYGWQGFAGQNSFLEFGKKPFADKETGGIYGHVVYGSTRPFDDPRLLLQNSWEPLVPHVRVNLYKEDVAPDGVTQTLTLIDHTETSSFDDWAQGFRSDGVPNMNCPGQSNTDLFFFGLKDQPNYLDWYNSQHNSGSVLTPLPYDSQFKCYDGMHNWNQLQPAPYDGMYAFPSVTRLDPQSGKPVGTNCTACTANPDSSDPYRSGAPMLPAGKYVVEVVVPPGYELVKEEDKNILIGDNYIAPVTQQFAGLGNIFILPDQAEIASAYNPNNPQNGTQDLGRPTLPQGEADTGKMETYWPCVGEQRTVPDFISLFPGSAEVSPFAGATRNLCDRKEITLENQMSALAKFYVFTSTHVASHFTGIITDDLTGEFDPFSPQFGEKFAPAYLPVSLKDWSGNEIGRTYSDQWGDYNGLNYSTWEVNPPNPTGYGPTMMVTCMNDRGTGPTPDPLYNPAYSQFCYELPFMPGQTGYFDTPVVSTSAFAGAGYNNPDCSYPDATPAISSVSGSDGIAGPWLQAAGTAHTLTITALGDQVVPNEAYSGPAATQAPFNQKTITRHYGFGATAGTVTVGGQPLTNVSWSDLTITGDVPASVPACKIQQQAQYAPGATPTQCGQLLITTADGKQSIDSVTVTIGGKKPTLLVSGQTIQSAIDAASPGDMIIVPPGAYKELVLMWKPVRLQGVGAASVVINANTQPAGKLDAWRRQVVCLFGLALNGTPISSPSNGNPGNPYDPSGTFNCSPAMQFSVDRLPLEATVGWQATLNGNLAEQLIEPTLMGALEGAGITVLAKGVNFPDPAQAFASDVFPTGTTLLTTNDCTTGANGTNPYPSNFWCNPSSIDGLGITNSSQGGGGILVHAWGHNIEIANNRVYNNLGTLSGGITIGQGEHPDVYLAGAVPTTVPGSCESDPLGTLMPGQVPNQSLPFCFDMNVNVHHNAVTLNSSLGDELFSSTPAGAGGVTMCNGSDYYRFNYNWVCGNLSTGDGGGVSHLGFSKNGAIEHNSILFNQSTNPTITTNGGGLLIMGAPDADPPCGLTTDKDCLSAPNTISPSDGTGPGLVVNANLILGNSADSGSGGGLRLQHINGTDVLNFPDGLHSCVDVTSPSCLWNTVRVTNNIIANNVAGWDGAGVSLQDALAVNIVNNTIVSNDSTASSGVLFGSLFAPLASTPGTNCTANNGSQSCPQVAGLVSVTNSPVLQANLPTSGFTCPPGHGTGDSCKNYSVPVLANNVIWHNRSFFIGVGDFGASTTNQQKVVTLFNSFGSTPAPTAPATGACPTGSYWDIGVRGDAGPADHSSGFNLSPTYSLLTDAGDYPGANNLGSDPNLVKPYCNGSRVPPENGGLGWLVPPGTNETNALPTPVFSLSPVATVDEGNNWINMQWGPLSLFAPDGQTALGNFSLTPTSPAVDYIPSTSSTYALAPSTDFFGNARPDMAGAIDIGAVEIHVVPPAPTLTNVTPASGYQGTNVAVTLTGTNLTSTTAINASGSGVTFSGLNVVNSTTVTANVVIAANATVGNDNVTITTPGGTSPAVAFTVLGTPVLNSITPASGARGYSVPVTISGAYLTGGSLNVSGTGITVSNASVLNDTTITATFTMSTATATLGAHNVTVTVGPVTSNAAVFTVVNPPAPTLTAIAPNTGVRSTAVPVTLTGTRLLTTSAITVSGGGITASAINPVSDTSVTATFTIAGNATVSGRTVRTTTLGGNSNTVAFTVAAAVTPTLSSVSPSAGVRGTAVPVTLTGTGLTGATAINVSATGVTSSGLTVVSDTSVTATLTITSAAGLGGHNVTITTPGGTSAPVTFTVQGPSLSSLAPNTGTRASSVPVTFTGTNLTGATAITGLGGGAQITVAAGTFHVVDSSRVTATLNIAPNATITNRALALVTPIGTTNTEAFSVTVPSAPTLTQVAPNTGVRGKAVAVTLTGSSFTTTGTTVAVSGGNVNVSGVTVVDSSHITATFTIAAGAATTARNVTVTTPGGSATLPGGFTVQGPTLTGISPTSGLHNTSVPVTLSGTNLAGATAVSMSGAGITCTGVTATDTSVSATCAITNGAAHTARNVTITTTIGSPTLMAAFTVQ